MSVLTENLEHINHSKPLEGPNMDPFDRMINVPQMIDCLIQIFNRSNAVYEEDNRSDREDGRDDCHMIDSSRKVQKCSTLPPGTKPLNLCGVKVGLLLVSKVRVIALRKRGC
ncbi:uncharacterized protein DEA37_0014296 [Paragonimus westermani]|uniref:Uncharacterized protein n=1 Tax=Paragonimus westermani TaxID=34504 RepID=A0A5J4N8U6_9TREM|nr:uncharacterized protein DEA37_0014296 [Paragonimus westermani]